MIKQEDIVTNLYRGKSKKEIAFVYRNHRLYKGESTKTEDILFLFDGRFVYFGEDDSAIENIEYTFDGKHLYKGKYSVEDAILYTYDSRYFYKGKELDDDQMIFYYDGKELWKKDADKNNVVAFSLNEYLPEVVFLVLEDLGLV